MSVSNIITGLMFLCAIYIAPWAYIEAMRGYHHCTYSITIDGKPLQKDYTNRVKMLQSWMKDAILAYEGTNGKVSEFSNLQCEEL